MREEGAKRGIALCLGKKERNEKSPNVNKRKKVKRGTVPRSMKGVDDLNEQRY